LRAVEARTRLPALAREERTEPLVLVSARKRQQLPALLAAIDAMGSSAARIVDVGAGRGHFTRLASARFGREALGIERDPARVAAARRASPGRARWVVMDACREPLALRPDDLAVGLHACGELGDRLVVAAAAAGADVALVSCCPQKIRLSARLPLSRAGAPLVVPRDVLGLANLTAQPTGVETSLGVTLEARRARQALQSLFRERGVDVAPGEEMRGVNRRRARVGFASLAWAALAARGLAPPTDAEIQRHAEAAEATHAAIRRLSLPRNMLSRPLELALVLDRASALEESGHHVRVAIVWDRAVSPRNIGLFASRSADRLPNQSLTMCSVRAAPLPASSP
jgi:hypothetical protein